MPQGSVLGPTLFLLYINDMPNQIQSSVGLFADDTMLYRRIRSQNDCNTLAADLSQLQEWEETWQMQFNASKCHLILVTNKKKPIIFDYQIHGQTLQRVDSAKYLGVEITSNITWSKHISQVTTKANRTSAFIQRNMRNCPKSIKNACYKSLVRPILEYASVVWDPHQQNDIQALEAVQKRAARRSTNNFSPYESATGFVQHLGLAELHTRRKRDKLLTMHKMYHRQISVPLPHSIQPAYKKTRGHMNKLTIPNSRINSHLHSFFRQRPGFGTIFPMK